MKQAETVTPAELTRILAVVSAERHAERNRPAVLLSYYAGPRVKEIAALTVGDVYTVAGDIKTFVALTAAQTKGHQGRTIVIGSKLTDALRAYLRVSKFNLLDMARPLLRSQKGAAFSANSLVSCSAGCMPLLVASKEPAATVAGGH